MELPDKFQNTAYFSSCNIREIFQISDMTRWRWTRDGILGSPKKRNGRNYYPRQAVLQACEWIDGTDNEKPDTAA